MIIDQLSSRFKKVFLNKHVILPVIHVNSEEKAIERFSSGYCKRDHPGKYHELPSVFGLLSCIDRH